MTGKRGVAVLIAALGAACAGRGVVADHGVVVAPEPIAAEVGAEVLRRGGNAVDASIAVAFALSVTYPSAGNIGGGGFMMVHAPGRPDEAIDYRETAPAGASRGMYLDADGEVIPGESLRTHRAAGVPGTIAGLWLAHQRHGSLPWIDLVSPAARLAEEGIVVSEGLALESAPDSLGIPPAGEVWRQPDLAATLWRVAYYGPEDFYRGETARLLAAEMARGGGLITLDDLANYRAIVREPVSATIGDLRVVSMPPPSSGGVALIQMLTMLEMLDPSPEEYVHVVAEIEKRVFADRSQYLGDPDFVDVPVRRLTSPGYLRVRAQEVRRGGRSDPATVRPGLESDSTTHFTVGDRRGGVVSNTYTLNASYGSGIVVGGAGFLLNNEMDDFSARPGARNLYGVTGSDANAIEPGKRMLSSMCPTFVYRDGELWLALGTPGGPTIFTTVFQVVENRARFGMTLADAVAAPRFHHQWPAGETDVLWIEEGIDDAPLGALGYDVRRRRLGDVQAVEFADGEWIGAADPRGRGVAARE